MAMTDCSGHNQSCWKSACRLTSEQIFIHDVSNSASYIQGNGMLSKFKKSSTALFVFRVMREMDKMRSELHEHRYYIEKNVALRTEHLIKRIDVLEACNAALCGKLALSQKKLAALQHIQTLKINEPNDSGAKLHIVNTRFRSVLRKHS
jgi:hypothetical protein